MWGKVNDCGLSGFAGESEFYSMTRKESRVPTACSLRISPTRRAPLREEHLAHRGDTGSVEKCLKTKRETTGNDQ